MHMHMCSHLPHTKRCLSRVQRERTQEPQQVQPHCKSFSTAGLTSSRVEAVTGVLVHELGHAGVTKALVDLWNVQQVR
jgi:hypothetical protein